MNRKSLLVCICHSAGFCPEQTDNLMDFNFENELAGKITLVTGGSKGTGKAIADRLLKAGATVIITARNQPEHESTGIFDGSPAMMQYHLELEGKQISALRITG